MAQIHVIGGAGERLEVPAIRKIGFSDLADALAKGWDDFSVMPSHAIFLCLIYPLVGVVLATWTSGNNALPLLFPLMSGFALIGPFAGPVCLRLNFAGDPSIKELLSRVREVVFDALSHTELPFESLVEHIKMRLQHAGTAQLPAVGDARVDQAEQAPPRRRAAPRRVA